MFLILTVLYNKKTETSDTLKGIIESADILNEVGAMLLLHDNSMDSLGMEELMKLKSSIRHLEYRHTPDNLSLSTIYNKTIVQGLLTPQLKYLLLLDDDSKIDRAFFKKAIEAAADNHSLMIPVIKNQGIIRSPMRSYIIKPSILSNVKPGILSSKNMMAINSGMAIAFDFLRSTGFHYDVRLKNYGTDSYFMKFYNAINKTVYILDYTFEHSLSFFDNSDIDKKIQIFKESKRSYLILYSDNAFNFVLASLYNFMSALKNALKYKTFKFFR